MDNLINNIESIPLSGPDLQMMSFKLGNKKTKWIPYSQLSQYSNIESLFGVDRSTGEHKFNTVFILLQILNEGDKPQIGHWVSLSFDGSNVLNYYDPYGLSVEEDISVTGESNLLPKLLSGYSLDINTHQHQSLRQNQNECGRHTVVRSIFHFMNNNQYNSVVMSLIKSKQVSNPDVLVSLLTAFLSKSDEVVKIFFKQKAGMDASSTSNSSSTAGRIRMPRIPRSRGIGGRVV